MGLGPEKEEIVLQKKEKKKKNRRNEKIKMGLVEAVSLPSETTAREVGDNRLRLMVDNKEHKRKLEKEKKVESVKESKLNVILEKDVVNGKDHLEGKKKKRKLEPNERINDFESISKEETNKVRKEKGDKLKKSKCKERKKETRDTGKDAVSSTFVEVLMDKEGGVKRTNGWRQSEKEYVSNIKEYEGQQEKQKKGKNKKMKGLEYCEKKRKTKKMNKQTEEMGDCEGENIDDNKELEQVDEEGKKQEKKENRDEHHDIEKNSVVRSQKFEQEQDYVDGSCDKNVEYKKKGRSRGKQEKNHIEGCSREFLIENLTGDENAISDHKEIAYNEGHPSSSNKKGGREKRVIDDEMEKREKKKRKRSKLVNDVEEKIADEGNLRTKDSGGSTSDNSKDFKPKKSSKRVKFSGHVEVFPSSDATDVEKDNEEQKLLGKRFSKEEDQMIKDAVDNYIEAHGLGENGLHMVLNCRSFPEIRGCWKEIASTLPWRAKRTIYWRAHNLFTRGQLTDEDKAFIMKFRDEYGPDWSRLAKSVGKHRIQLKDHWRQMKNANLKKGHWSQDEYQNLFELVNLDLQMKVREEKNIKYGMLRDNISWSAISEKLGTRTSSCCCRKWYHALTSSMVMSGEWDDSDDYRLLDELLKLDACCVEDVDWDNLIDQRSGEVCLKRWKQMCLHIGNHGIKPFAEQVEVLAKRYCPTLLDVREAIDSRPIVQ